MKSLRKLGAALVLMCALGLSALADEPCVPGGVQTPPCTAAQVTPDDGAAPGEVNAPPAANAGSDYSVTQVAVDLLQEMLSIF